MVYQTGTVPTVLVNQKRVGISINWSPVLILIRIPGGQNHLSHRTFTYLTRMQKVVYRFGSWTVVDFFPLFPMFMKNLVRIPVLPSRTHFPSLHVYRKEEYQSPAGLAVLFDRAGGNQTEAMADAISKMKLNSVHAENLIKEVREIWDTWDAREAAEFQGDDMLRYDSFYNGFMAPYFGCYRCWDTKKALSAIDMDADNSVDWKEFKVFLKWALNQYPDIKDTEELLDVTFRKGIIPSMHDEVVVKKRTKKGTATGKQNMQNIEVKLR